MKSYSIGTYIFIKLPNLCDPRPASLFFQESGNFRL